LPVADQITRKAKEKNKMSFFAEVCIHDLPCAPDLLTAPFDMHEGI
jgi:hypothetical protein